MLRSTVPMELRGGGQFQCDQRRRGGKGYRFLASPQTCRRGSGGTSTGTEASDGKSHRLHCLKYSGSTRRNDTLKGYVPDPD